MPLPVATGLTGIIFYTLCVTIQSCQVCSRNEPYGSSTDIIIFPITSFYLFHERWSRCGIFLHLDTKFPDLKNEAFCFPSADAFPSPVLLQARWTAAEFCMVEIQRPEKRCNPLQELVICRKVFTLPTGLCNVLTMTWKTCLMLVLLKVWMNLTESSSQSETAKQACLAVLLHLALEDLPIFKSGVIWRIIRRKNTVSKL